MCPTSISSAFRFACADQGPVVLTVVVSGQAVRYLDLAGEFARINVKEAVLDSLTLRRQVKSRGVARPRPPSRSWTD